MHGAMDVDVPILFPVSDSATLFFSLPQLQMTIDRRFSHNSENSQGGGDSGIDDSEYAMEIDCISGSLKYTDLTTTPANLYLLHYLVQN